MSNRRYQTSLEELLRKATQANDLDAAIKIKDKLTTLPGAKAKPTTPELLKSYLVGTSWAISDNKPDAPQTWTMTFQDDGTFRDSRSGRAYVWTVEGAGRIKLFNFDPVTFNDDFTLFTAKGAQIKYFGHLKP